jgi:DNA-binding IclR family transcriptional regulator
MLLTDSTSRGRFHQRHRSAPEARRIAQNPERLLDVGQREAQIRRDGYGITHAHRTPNTVGIAAPFFDGEGQVAGSLGFLIPEFRWASSPQDEVVRALVNAAAGMSRQLGGATPAPINGMATAEP